LKIKSKIFGQTKTGKTAHLFTLRNTNKMEVSITNFGGIITALKVPDLNGDIGDVVLGFDNLNDYEKVHPYFGGIVGRSANRINKGSFLLDGKKIQLSQNENMHHLHGGFEGFDKKIWNAETDSRDQYAKLILNYNSKNGEEGYPGNLACQVSFTLYPNNELSIEYRCKTDETTIVNLTHHDYFNLKDGGETDILGHDLRIFADQYTPTNSAYISTGKIEKLSSSFLDFRTTKNIEQQLNEGQLTNGFNHNFVLNRKDKSLNLAAILCESQSGRSMEIWTTQPGLQFYTAGYLGNSIIGKNKTNYRAFHGLCLEGQSFPDAPNHINFPSTILRKGEEYHHEYRMKFKIIKSPLPL